VTNRDPTALVDIHSHLVPGVDDGARDVSAVLESVEQMTRQGIRRIVTTPHIEANLTLDRARLDARLSQVSDAWERASQALRETFPEVGFHRGHEICLDVPDADFSDPRIRMAGTSFVLVEWPRLQLPPGTVGVLTRIREKGFRPIVAHPERYAGMNAAIGVAGQWRDAGAALQVNYGSLVGRYGPGPQSNAIRLLRRGWVDYLASDFHGNASLKIYKDEAWAFLTECDGDEVLNYLSRTNPSRLIDDLPPLPAPLLPPERTFWARFRRMLRRSTA
jgi:protein-tyrosine phosphatase